MNAYGGSYSPSGRHVIYRREVEGDYRLVVVGVDGHGARTIFRSATLRPRFIDWSAQAPA